ncbi:MAG: DUF3829 domain-containing protein [Dysgonomonas sp.]|nr:DUF3829 domain-containing protein [Dysgonomonas sp.]
MKKLFFTLLSLSILLVSCGGSANKGSENVDSKAEANQIISYTNDVIDYLNGSGGWTRSNTSRINDMIKFMRTGRKPTVVLPLMPNTAMNVASKKKDLTVPPTVMSEEEKTYFKENMTTYKEAYESFTANCSTLYKYIQNQDYKDDKFEKGKMLADSIEYRDSILNTIRGNMYDKIEVVTEKAEAIILSDSPLKDPILTLKAELKAFEELNSLYSDYTENAATPEQVDAAYQALATTVEKNKDMYKETLEAQKKQSAYDSFYKECDDALATYRKALREVKAKKRLSERDFKSFSSDYNSLINAYNRFIK